MQWKELNLESQKVNLISTLHVQVDLESSNRSVEILFEIKVKCCISFSCVQCAWSDSRDFMDSIENFSSGNCITLSRRLSRSDMTGSYFSQTDDLY